MKKLSITYDHLSDIVYGLRGESRPNYAEEPFEGILILRDIETHEVIGFTIINYTVQKEKGFTKNIPHFPGVFIPY